jgi:hypothetical protein
MTSGTSPRRRDQGCLRYRAANPHMPACRENCTGQRSDYADWPDPTWTIAAIARELGMTPDPVVRRARELGLEGRTVAAGPTQHFHWCDSEKANDGQSAAVASSQLLRSLRTASQCPLANTMSTPAPGAGASTPTLSHDGSNSLTDSNASSASNSPGAGASPHTGYSSGMAPSAGTGSGTADGTTDTGATSPGSGKSAARR